MAGQQRTLRAVKQVIRKELKCKLNQLSHDVKHRESAEVLGKLFALPEYQSSKAISIYLSMPTEIYTQDLLVDLFKKDKKCYIPHYFGDNMRMVRLKDWSDYESLPLNSWNIKQPSNDDVRETDIDSGGLDLIVVPGLGFTRDGKRLGRGKGYYDGYFRKYKEKFQTLPALVGLAFSCQILDDLPTDEYDVIIDKVLHPTGSCLSDS